MKERSIFVIIVLSIILIGIGLFVATQADLSFLLPEQASAESVLIDGLFRMLMGIATVIFLLVEGVLLYTVIRFRRKPGEEGDGKPVHGNNTLEIVWTIIPAIIVAVIGVYAYQVLTTIEQPRDDPLVVQIIGRQFSWEFVYPESRISSGVMHLPVDRPVQFQIESKDVIHSFWVPAFRLKQDATPGQIDEFVITPTKIGRYPIRCAELCGAAHATMVSEVVVQSKEDFEAWLEAGGIALSPPSEGETSSQPSPGEGDTAPDISSEEVQAQGRALFIELGCGACHTLADAGGAGAVGPPLDGIAAAADTRVDGMDAHSYMLKSIINPDDHVVKGFPPGLMPKDYGDRISEEKIEMLVKYLLSQ